MTHVSAIAELQSIGEVAELLGTTTRTLRYYEELGLVSSSRLSETAQRRYGPDEIERLRRIRELQTLLGLDLDEIGEQLAATDRLDGLREEFRAGPAPHRREEIIAEGIVILERLRERVTERQELLAAFAAELEVRMGKYLAAAAEISGAAGSAKPPRAPRSDSGDASPAPAPPARARARHGVPAR